MLDCKLVGGFWCVLDKLTIGHLVYPILIGAGVMAIIFLLATAMDFLDKRRTTK